MRRLLLLGALAGLVGYPLLDESATSAGMALAQTERAETRAAAKANAAERLELPERRGLTRTQGELFGAPPPSPKPITKKAQPPAPVAAAPVAPQVPYRFAGKVRKGSEEEVLISKGDVVFPAAGEWQQIINCTTEDTEEREKTTEYTEYTEKRKTLLTDG